ncbi:hypothetical protein WJX84_007056 [Apatococcus fuscideae]|uniref:Uncharacterized protein n=1 Tax=Apatococcus fuscideae TaxID=2026836 RepID=A0AAW1SRZ0_9CHLO
MATVLALVVTGCLLRMAGVSAATKAKCGAGLHYCKGINQCYSADAYKCLKGFLCPSNTCLCGANICYTSQYGCKDGGLFLLDKDNEKDNKNGICGGSSAGDPLVRGFDGCRWYLKGIAGQVYNLLAGVEDTVNTLLVPANLTDADHDGNGTFHGTLSFRHLDHIVGAEVSAEGNLTGAASFHHCPTLPSHGS